MPCSPDIWSAEALVPDVDEAQCLLRNQPPACPHRGAMARPNILMFGDSAWVGDRSYTQARRQESWLRTVSRPLVIEIGAGTTVPTVRWFSERIIHEFDGRLVWINPTEHRVPTSLDVGIPVGALQGLSAIATELGLDWQLALP